MRKIKFGIARGMFLPINRRTNLRPETGLFERPIASHVARLARGAQVSYDIGAERGYYTLALVNLGVPAVFAFDADPARVAELRQTLDANRIGHRVTVIEGRVGSDAKTSSNLDELAETGAILPPDLVKMDIDGAEYEALLGMSAVISKRHPAFVIEVHTRELEDLCATFLRSRSYSVRVVDASRIERLLLPELRTAPGITHNRWLVAEWV